MLEITPGSVFVTVITTVALPPLASVPRSHVTVPMAASKQFGAETNVVRRWRLCVNCTAVQRRGRGS